MDMNSEHVKIVQEHGVLYPNGTFDWNTQSWFGTIDTPEKRAEFQKQYNLRMQNMGAVGAELQFVTRMMVHACTPYTLIDDEQVVEPEPNTPPVDEETPAAPDEDAEPPTPDAPVEEESPVDQGEPESTDPEPPATDDEGVPADGG